MTTRKNNDIWFYFWAAMAGVATGVADVVVDDLLFTALLVLAACMLLGTFSPRWPWRWVLVVGAFVPLTELAAFLILTVKPTRAQVFGVHAGGQCRRTDEVRKHHRDLTALGSVLRWWSNCCRWRSRRLRCTFIAAIQFGNCAQQLAAMAEQDAEFFQVLIGHRSGKTQRSIPFSAKRWAYSDMPSFSSQSAICCTAAHPLT